MSSSANHPAVTILKGFFNAMNEWGDSMIKYYSNLDWENADERILSRDKTEQRRRLEAIFEKYCEAGLKAKRLQDEGMSYDLDSPDYDLAHEPIVSVSEAPGRVTVETKLTHSFRLNFKYEIININRSWKVRDNKKRSSDGDAKWRPDML